MGVAGPNRHGDSNPSGLPRRGKGGQSRRGRLTFTIASDLAAGREVQNQILDEARRHGFHGQSLFAINLALEEAITNAIKHGNGLDPKKQVYVEAKVTPGRAEIIVEDEGSGFDRRHIPDPTVEENLEKCSGRGILLIETYMNRVRWDHGGRRVRMVKVNEPELPAP
jgi:serine/threonine-protein kinase RsbW